ncbi:MAG: 5-(carboxyamino)imidazole ribonucleotide synthase [Brachybacterium sp.]|nr:5-(carboxyamino)imidazole ribonucleotide synthase [Brachybacterium sp.]
MPEDPHPQTGPPTIGIVGGGQLARMMIPPAVELDLPVAVLAGTAEDSAARVAAHARIGSHLVEDDVRALAGEVDVLTFDHEHVPTAILRGIEDEGLAAVRPGPDALIHAQDKLIMREHLTALGHPCPRWWRVETPQELTAVLEEAGGRAVVKTPRGGYDGHGVAIVEIGAGAAERDPERLTDWFAAHDALLVEELVPFTRELSIQVARRPSGETRAYPVVASLQKDGVCYEVIAPAPGLSEEAARRIHDLGRAIAEDLDVTGMLAVELFETADGRVLVNELAMRPHNTGHWSMDGAVTGQFEQHLRAVADLPLGSTEPLAPAVVMVNLLGGSREDLAAGARAAMEADPAVRIHLYGKAVRPGRKLGHVTLLGTDPSELLDRAHRAEALIIDRPRPADEETP